MNKTLNIMRAILPLSQNQLNYDLGNRMMHKMRINRSGNKNASIAQNLDTTMF